MLLAPAANGQDSDKTRGAAVSELAGPADQLVVHEWGTFTSLHDERGSAIGGINADDEPVPKFVHRIANFLLLGPRAIAPILYQGAPRCHPDVTMRLETPVVYFYPGQDTELPLVLDVEVAFRAGWLSEYYPDAEVDAPGVKGQMAFGPITADTVGRLQWRQLQVGTGATGPETSSEVWLAPRAVDSASVTTTAGESERYLFYRGVGHVDSPLRVSRDDTGLSLILTADFPPIPQSREIDFVVPALWLVEVREGGSCAFRAIEGFHVPNDGKARVVAQTAATFDDADFCADNIEILCSVMRSALIEDGLFADEADALLNTWRLSYFETPGLRLFFLLPRAWTDDVLPMTVSTEAELVRTMVGRIEIVMPEQRRRLREIAAGPAPDPQRLRRKMLESPAFLAYSKLGRFRNALLLDELAQRPTLALQAFVDAYGLGGYGVSESRSAGSSNED